MTDPHIDYLATLPERVDNDKLTEAALERIPHLSKEYARLCVFCGKDPHLDMWPLGCVFIGRHKVLGGVILPVGTVWSICLRCAERHGT